MDAFVVSFFLLVGNNQLKKRFEFGDDHCYKSLCVFRSSVFLKQPRVTFSVFRRFMWSCQRKARVCLFLSVIFSTQQAQTRSWTHTHKWEICSFGMVCLHILSSPSSRSKNLQPSTELCTFCCKVHKSICTHVFVLGCMRFHPVLPGYQTCMLEQKKKRQRLQPSLTTLAQKTTSDVKRSPCPEKSSGILGSRRLILTGYSQMIPQMWIPLDKDGLQ